MSIKPTINIFETKKRRIVMFEVETTYELNDQQLEEINGGVAQLFLQVAFVGGMVIGYYVTKEILKAYIKK
jgi:lactobin A/cerein 7B family class IIb bacteriocin